MHVCVHVCASMCECECTCFYVSEHLCIRTAVGNSTVLLHLSPSLLGFSKQGLTLLSRLPLNSILPQLPDAVIAARSTVFWCFHFLGNKSVTCKGRGDSRSYRRSFQLDNFLDEFNDS